MNSQEKITKLIRLLMNKSILEHKNREEMEEILGELGQISSISELICDLVHKAPYLSEEQADALETDLDEIFSKLNVEDSKSLGEKIKALKEEIIQGKFIFALENIPSDAAKAVMPSQIEIEDLIKRVIDDIFGTLINNLPPDDKLRERIKIDNTIERAVNSFLK